MSRYLESSNAIPNHAIRLFANEPFPPLATDRGGREKKEKKREKNKNKNEDNMHLSSMKPIFTFVSFIALSTSFLVPIHRHCAWGAQ
jgi:hypothetical protein